MTNADKELLYLLTEEAAEIIQIVQKILRHGLQSYNPFDENRTPNIILLEKEIGHINNAVSMLIETNLINKTSIRKAEIEKAETIYQWLHYN